MIEFSELLKRIRINAGLSRQELAEILGVSRMYITQIENNTREPSKNFINALSVKLRVRTFSIMPFISSNENIDPSDLSTIEKILFKYGKVMQNKLIDKNSKYLKITNA